MKLSLFLIMTSFAVAAEPCRIEIVDKENGWPVPMVELRTTHQASYVSDNAGVIAIQDPELLDRDIWFHVKGHGYHVPKDGFGYEGLRTRLAPGGNVRIEVERRNVAKRLGRLTGMGRFAEMEKLGGSPPDKDTGIAGCDSVLMSRLGDRLFWLWGDTGVPGYPLGVFHSTAAVTPLRPVAKFEPPISIPFQLFHDDGGKPRGVAKMPGDGPTWLTGMISIGPQEMPDSLVATYSKIKGHLDEYEIGLCKWDPASTSFKPEKLLWKESQGPKPALLPKGHPVRWRDPDGQRWLLFGDPFPAIRCHDTYASWSDPSTWRKVETPPSPRAHDDGTEIKPHRGSIAWSPFRNRWIAIFTQEFGKPSAFGEIWYVEADSPMGPWGKAVKILSHDNYTFYNPRIHPELTDDDASFVVFEGTYTAEFSDGARPTARYDYNQILYRLDLDDARLSGAQ